jgi:hypothetical protein
VDGLGRDWRYGLNYYSVTPFPDCSAERRRFVLRQRDGKRHYLTSEFTVPVGASRE